MQEQKSRSHDQLCITCILTVIMTLASLREHALKRSHSRICSYVIFTFRYGVFQLP